MAVTYDRSGLSNFDYPFGILLRLCVFTFWVPFCHVRYDFRINMMFGHPLLPVVCRTHVLFTLFVFVCVYWCPTHIVLCFCFVFLLLVANFSGLSVVDYPFVILQFLWIVRFWLPFRYSPVSLDCPLLITLSLFSDVFSVHKAFLEQLHKIRKDHMFRNPDNTDLYLFHFYISLQAGGLGGQVINVVDIWPQT